MYSPKASRKHFDIYIKIFAVTMVGIIACVGLPETGLTAGNSDEVKLSEGLHQGLNYLLSLVGQENSVDQTINIELIAPVLEFVASDKPDKTKESMDESFDMPSAYHEFEFEKDLNSILRFSFNPSIPSYITTPSSVRLATWAGTNGKDMEFPDFAKLLKRLDNPIVVRGVETLENTPDIFTGGYYKYDLERTILLLKFEGKPVLISLSKQKEPSDVGKKGVVLGSDDDWNYLYSGVKGLNKTGLGWVNSYMYDSYSIIVYYETAPEKPLVRCGAFKWLQAGWKKINMVKPEHISRGLQRFASTYKSIIENPSLPDADKIAEACRRISDLDLNTLKNINQNYLSALKKRYAEDKSLSAKWVAGLFEDHAYVDSMNRDELQSVLVIEYLKRALGKPYEIDIEKL